jgi:hypothetical protein
MCPKALATEASISPFTQSLLPSFSMSSIENWRSLDSLPCHLDCKLISAQDLQAADGIRIGRDRCTHAVTIHVPQHKEGGTNSVTDWRLRKVKTKAKKRKHPPRLCRAHGRGIPSRVTSAWALSKVPFLYSSATASTKRQGRKVGWDGDGAIDRLIDWYKWQVGEQVAPKLNRPRPMGMDHGYLIANTMRFYRERKA